MATNVVLFLLNEILKMKQMWSFLNVLYITVQIAYYILRDYFFKFWVF